MGPYGEDRGAREETTWGCLRGDPSVDHDGHVGMRCLPCLHAFEHVITERASLCAWDHGHEYGALHAFGESGCREPFQRRVGIDGAPPLAPLLPAVSRDERGIAMGFHVGDDAGDVRYAFPADQMLVRTVNHQMYVQRHPDVAAARFTVPREGLARDQRAINDVDVNTRSTRSLESFEHA